ncbi:MAG: hypothetical protein ACRD93_09415 [Nitrososphaeraceae archaeon]
MSIILGTPLLRRKKITKSKHGEPKTSSILLVSVAITLAIILLMYAGISYTEGTMKQYSTCRDKIVGYEQSGIYTSPEEFRLALSFCDSK